MEKKKITFSVGEKYRGLVNGEIFTVQKILEPGCHETASGGVYYLPRPKIVFITKNDKPVECSLAMAENLLLERISPAAPAPGMRLPKSAEWDALDKISGGSNTAINWNEMFSWCQDADPLCPLSRAIRGFVSSSGITHRSADFRSSGIGFRPAVEAPEAMVEGAAMVIGTLYMNGLPVKVPQNPTWLGDVACYTPGTALELRAPLEDSAYQVRAIKASSALIADRAVLRNVSWNDLAVQGCVR